MGVQYAVINKDGMWCLLQCGQQIRVFDRREAAAQAARELASYIGCPDVKVELIVQTATGELRPEPLGGRFEASARRDAKAQARII